MAVSPRISPFLLLCSTLAIGACGGGDDDDGTGDVDAAGSGIDAGAQPECTRNGFTATDAGADRVDGAVIASAATAPEPPNDVILVEHYFDFGATDGPHTTELSGANFSACGDCVLILADCTQEECAKTFFAHSGTVDVTALGAASTPYAVTVTDLVLPEVTIDSETYESTVVDGGETWCIDSFTLEATLGGEEPPA